MKINDLPALLILILFSLFQSMAYSAHSHGVDVTNSTAYSFTSQLLSKDMTIEVYLPENYSDKSEKYPVLYVLDGQWHVNSAIAIQKALRVPDDLPEMIVVGIKSSEPIRRTWFGAQSRTFHQVMADEVIPFVDSKWRTNNNRIVFGWEAGA